MCCWKNMNYSQGWSRDSENGGVSISSTVNSGQVRTRVDIYLSPRCVLTSVVIQCSRALKGHNCFKLGFNRANCRLNRFTPHLLLPTHPHSVINRLSRNCRHLKFAGTLWLTQLQCGSSSEQLYRVHALMVTHIVYPPPSPSPHPTRAATIRKLPLAKFYLPSPDLPHDFRCRQFINKKVYESAATMNIQRQVVVTRPKVNEFVQSSVHLTRRAPKNVSPQCDLFFQASTVHRASADVLKSNLNLRMVSHVPTSGSRDRGEQIQEVPQIALHSISERDSATVDGGGEDGGHGGSSGGYSGGYKGGSGPGSGEGWSDDGRGGNAPLFILFGGKCRIFQSFESYLGIPQAFAFDNYRILPEVCNA